MKKLFGFFMAIFMVLSLEEKANAQQNALYTLDKKISVPGNGGYDYLFIDDINRRLYVSHATSVNVIDLNTEQVIGEIKDMKGVHGIAIVDDLHKGFISDGTANAVVVFDINTLQKISTVSITGKDPDAIIYDPFSKMIFAFNGDSKNASVVDPVTLKQIGSVDLGGGPEFAVADGEGKIYNNLEDKNSLNVIDSKTLKVISNFPLSPCGGPTGLALDKSQNRLFTVCRQDKGMSVVDMTSGKVIKTLPIGAGVDAVVYDPITSLIICSNGDGTATVIKKDSSDSYSVVQTLSTQYRAKTMALDLKTHKIYLSAPDYEKGTRKIIPGTFNVLVYKLNG